MTHESRPKAAPDGAGRRATEDTPVTLGDLKRAGIHRIAGALGAAYAGGPFPCPARCRRATWPPEQVSRATCVQTPSRAHCYACGRTFTVFALRRIVLDDDRLARRLAAELSVAS